MSGLNHYGIPKEEARERRQGIWGNNWRKPHLVSLDKTPVGAIVIASVPSGRGSDLMMGSRLEVWLFPDGTYEADISGLWLMSHKMEGRIGKAALANGCYLHSSCSTCPYPDCVAKSYKLVCQNN